MCLAAQPLLPASEIGVMPVDKDMRFSFMAGTIIEEDRPRFERMLFRATKGASLPHHPCLPASLPHQPLQHEPVLHTALHNAASRS